MIKTLRHKYALSEEGAKDMLKACGACTLSNIVLMLPVGLLYLLADGVIMGKDIKSDTLAYAAATLLYLVLIALTYCLQYNATFLATYKESGKRRVSLAETLQRLPMSFFGRRDLSDLTSTIMSDCAKIETASSHYMPQLFASMLSTALVGASLFCIDWRMAAAALWVLLPCLAIVGCSKRIQQRLGRAGRAAQLDLDDSVQECLETSRDLRACSMEAEYLAKLDRKIRQVERRQIKTELGTAVFVVSAQMILKLGIATTAFAGGVLMAHGELQMSVFLMFLIVVSRLYDPLQAALINLAALIATDVSCERMSAILEHPRQIGSAKLTNRGCEIRFDHVNFAYDGGAKVLDDISFTARQGEITALVGPSGGGKTTVTRLAARFYDIPSGRITIGGMDVSKIDPETLFSLFAIVFQDVTLFNNTIMENIRIGRRGASDEDVRRAAALAGCQSIVERLPNGFGTMIGENGCRLSGGERQRISIARAFLKNAPIILLDEATASLDAMNEAIIQRSLAKLVKGKTVLVVAHRRRTIAAADRVVELKQGKVSVLRQRKNGEMRAATKS